MITDGIDTYVIFFYVDIQWSRAEEDDNLAQVGFNAGDGIHYYRVPGTDTAEGLLALSNTSNVGITGQWVFKVSGSSVEVGGCLQLTGTFVCGSVENKWCMCVCMCVCMSYSYFTIQ